MQFMIIPKSDDKLEAGEMPGDEYMAAMDEFTGELIEAGVLKGGAGLYPSSAGARVTFSNGETTVTDGPFAEAKELIAGYWLWELDSMQEAIEWVRKVPANPDDDENVIEIRQVFEHN